MAHRPEEVDCAGHGQLRVSGETGDEDDCVAGSQNRFGDRMFEIIGNIDEYHGMGAP